MHLSILFSTTMPKNPNNPNSPNYPSTHHHHHHHHHITTLDLLILVLVLFSAAFLLTSSLSHLGHVIYHFAPDPKPHIVPIAITTITLSLFFLLFRLCRGPRSRNCGKRGCKSLKNAMEFDLQLQSEEMLRFGENCKSVRDINELAWKGDTEDNPDYECLRAELRRMAPVNGRAVLIFREKCGCPVAKLEGWGPKQRKRHKKNLALTGG